MKEKIGEILDGLKDRLASPFLLTFTAVWSIQHWKLLFLVSTFDSELTQAQKISIIERYLNEHGYWGMIWHPFLCSIGSMLVYYLIIILVKNLQSLYLWMLAGTYKLTNMWRNLRTKEEYNELWSANVELQKSNNDLISQRNTNLIEQNKREEELRNRESILQRTNSELDNLSKQNKELEREKGIYKTFFEENKDFQNDAKNPVLYLLALKFNINNSEMQLKETGKRLRDVLDGTWRQYTYDSVAMTSQTNYVLQIDGSNFYNQKLNEFVGSIENFEFESNSKVLQFTLRGRDGISVDKYILVQIVFSKFIGFRNNDLVSLVRLDNRGNEMTIRIDVL